MDGTPHSSRPVRRLYVPYGVSYEKQWERAQDLATLGNRVWFHVHGIMRAGLTEPCNDQCKFLEE